MRILIVVVAAVLVGGCWRLQWRLTAHRREQFVRLTEKRHSELLDVERRQHEEQ